ncbi:MAG: cytochrome b N-terminal domain-containing protein, partial [Nitrospinota bacterium]
QLNKIFTPSMNPMYYLGAITFFFFLIVVVSGIYLFLFYEMNPAGAYDSVKYITETQKNYGGVIRSLHRYGSDGLVIVIVIHILQVFFSDRFRKYRWVAWVSGVFILPPIWFDGITGYLMVWDEKSQIMAHLLASFFDGLPIFSQPISRNFLYDTSVTPTLFLVMSFVHISIPVLLLILVWVHCMRISRPLINPPAQSAVTIVAALLLISLLKPVASEGPAKMSLLVGEVEIDWFYMFAFPIMNMFNLSMGWIWVTAIAGFAIFTSFPWIIKSPAKPKEEKDDKSLVIPMVVPEVDLSRCTGCNICLEVCPFLAISIVPRSDGRSHESEVKILSERCSESGFCVAACPFDALTIGEFSETSVGKRINDIFAEKKGEVKPAVMVFVCERSLDVASFLSPDMTTLADNTDAAATIIPCIGFLGPSIIESTFKAGALGIAVVGCRSLDCHYREGRRRVKKGFSTEQELFPVEEMKHPNIQIFHISRFQLAKLENDIEEFIEEIKAGPHKVSGPPK